MFDQCHFHPFKMVLHYKNTNEEEIDNKLGIYRMIFVLTLNYI